MSKIKIKTDIELKDVKKGMVVYDATSGNVELIAVEDARDTGVGIECKFKLKGSDQLICCSHVYNFEHYGPRLYYISNVGIGKR